MPSKLRHALTGVLILTLVALLGCGGSSSPQQSQQQRTLPPMPAVQPGVSMPTLPPDDFDADNPDNPDKATSAVYKIFFRDTVNHQSGGRWLTFDNKGKKAWTLSNVFHSAPKAWLLGGNYWNGEDDELVSAGFTVEDETDGLALSFYARWSIAAGDHGTVRLWDGDDFQQVTDFTGGSNPSYPAWDKYYFQLPANNTGSSKVWQLTFHFTSNASVNDWGLGVDSVAVYQTQLAEPVNAQASDSDGSTYMTWDASTDPLVPDAYEIWRADSEFGDYTLEDTTFDPANNTQSGNVSDAQCPDTNWYKARAIKDGWPPGPYSVPDEGCWNL